MTALDPVQDGSTAMNSGDDHSPGGARIFRLFGWIVLAIMAAFLLNNYLTYWQNLPGIAPIFGGVANGSMPILWSWLQLALYAAFALWGIAYVLRSGNTLREDSVRISNINAFLIRAAFFAVLIVGLVDAAISFLRVEGLLVGVVGEGLAEDLGKSRFRGAYVHMPLIALSVIIAAFTRTLGFTWLALLVVVAELIIVIGRFVFSYEQAFLSDLVRFWYAALFLFASAYTLLEEGHVRVDVFYAGMAAKTKGYVNAIGSVVLGMSLCAVILIIGMGGKQNIINSPILSYEVTQAGFGLYVKYLMAGFLGVFAVTMMVQFVAYFLDAIADIRGEPGGRDHDSAHSIS
ncbi:MAG: TRAP transporter small permease subunit [Roseibium sp.]|uniref:TRAP transporter small permease subunit n=1 Tax=Roseibium sp. TaxID=1936156 RepID=UPI001B0B4BB5|nr:TRAP transporter small permease subunit [Roseibium sp.]MBO6892975.1 TRAP transporter small permease subunit [Roseibium sp.]MBO6928076.1 TRAP transporter small permease subunit [Roseibium sp.]